MRPAIAPSTRNVCSVSISLCPICSICAAPASASSTEPAVRRSIGGMSAPAGTGGGRREGGGMGLVPRAFAAFNAATVRSRPVSLDSGARAGWSGFGGPRVPALASRLPSPVSRVLKATSGCHPTVRIPSADRANNPTRTPPAVPSAPCTRAARYPGNSPTSRSVRLHPAYSAARSATLMPVPVPMPYGSNTTRPNPSAAVRSADRLPSRPKAASAQATPSAGRSTAPTPRSFQSPSPSLLPQLPVTGVPRRVRPRKTPTASAPIPINSWRPRGFM